MTNIEIVSASPFLHELQALEQWVVTHVDGDIKIPLDPKTGKKASVSDPSTWSSFATAQYRCEADPRLTLGFVLTAGDPYSVIDLDSHKRTNSAVLDTLAAAPAISS